MPDDSEKQEKLGKALREFNIVDYYKKAISAIQFAGRPGVTFTPEQIAQIKALDKRDKREDH